MNWYFLPPFIGSTLLLFLGIFVYAKNRTSKINIIFALECLTSFIWQFSYSMMYAFSYNEVIANFYMKIGYVGVIYIPIFYYHFIIEFFERRQEKIIVYFSYVIATIFAVLNFETNLFTNGLIKYYWGYYPQASIAHPIFLIFFIGFLILAFYDTLSDFWSKDKILPTLRREQVKYIFWAYIVYSPACLDFLANYNIALYPFGYIFSTIFLSIVTYAIVRHQLMDIELVIKKTLVFAGLFTVVYAVFAFFALLGQVFFERFVTQNRWIAMVPSVLMVTIMLRPLESFLITITDKYLFQKKYNYKELLKIFTSEVLTVLELDKLIDLTKERLIDIMKIESCGVVLEPVSIAAEAKIPITFQNKTIGTLLLGKKKSDEAYTRDDFDILQPLSKALGIAISNAKLFDELSKTKARMAEKDKMATIGTLAAGMAHEIRNPITTIRNFADYLPEKYEDKIFMDKFGKLIPREIDRIESIARSLLEFSSSEEGGAKETFSMEEPIRTVMAILEPQYKTSGISVVCDYKKKQIIRGSKIQLQDALFNMLNYILAETQKNGRIIIGCEDRNDKLVLCIKSEGLIVADHIMKDVFEPVSGLHREKRGFGFNLFVAKQLLERNEAVLAISSDKTKGSEFRIYFKNFSGQPS